MSKYANEKRIFSGTLTHLGDRLLGNKENKYTVAEMRTDSGEVLSLGELTVAPEADRDIVVGNHVTLFATRFMKNGKVTATMVWCHRDDESGRVLYSPEIAGARTKVNAYRWLLLALSPCFLILLVLPFFLAVWSFFVLGRLVRAMPTAQEFESRVKELSSPVASVTR